MVVHDVRLVLESMCNDPSLENRALLQNVAPGYRMYEKHQMNRNPDSIREKVETHLDMVLRADPGATDGVVTCRVYSPEVNTQEKLRVVLANHLEEEGADVQLSASTMQRMVKEYLNTRDSRIKFTQSDHNACPSPKTFHYAILQFSFEVKELETFLA